MKINLKKKVMLALLAGGMLCANGAFADEPDTWYGVKDGTKYTVTLPSYSSGATLTLDSTNYDASANIEDFFGGYSDTAAANNNTIDLQSLKSDTQDQYLYAGFGTSANNNKVVLGSSDRMAEVTGDKIERISGGWATEGEANYNTVTIYGMLPRFTLYGGLGKTEASHNVVNIEYGIPSGSTNLSVSVGCAEDTTIHAGDMMAAANDNILNVRNFDNDLEVQYFCGGYARIALYEDYSGNVTVNANRNTLNYSASQDVIFDGGLYAASGTGWIQEGPEGGLVKVIMQDNTSNLYSGSFSAIYRNICAATLSTDNDREAGKAEGLAERNIVNIKDGIFKECIYGADVYGGNWADSHSGTVNLTVKENAVKIEKGSFMYPSDGDYIFIAGTYIDAENGGDTCDLVTVEASGNYVDITGGNFVSSYISGVEYYSWLEGNSGFAAGSGSATFTGNNVKINGGTFQQGWGRAKIQGVSVETEGYSDTGGGSFEVTAKNNKVEIRDGSFSGTDIYGVYANMYFDDAQGTIEIDIEGNTIDIYGGTYNGVNIYGGYVEVDNCSSSSIAIKDNVVNINGGTFVNGLGLYGSYVDGAVCTSTGNTLNLKTVIAGEAAEVKDFQKMNFTVPAGVSSDAVMLKSDAAVALSGVNVTVDLNGLSLTGNDYITLIQNVADAGFSETDHLKILDVAGTYCLVYTNGTPTVKADYTVKQGSTVKSEGTDASHEYANTIIKGRDTTDGGMTSGYTVTVRRGTYGSVTSGDPSRIYAVKSNSVDVCNNEIHIFDGKFFFNHYPDADNSIITGIVDTTGGGCDVYNNKVTIDGGEFFFNVGIEETTVQPVIAAGMADGGTESDAHKVYGNIVEINGGFFKNTGVIVAGVARIGGTAHSDSVVGGTSLANGNKLIVNNMKFMGQYSLEGGVGIADNPLPVNYNTVEIKNVVFESGSMLQVVGGHGIGRTGASVSHNLVDVQGISSSEAMLVVSAAQAVGNSLPTSSDAINITVEGNKLNVANVDALYLAVMGAVGSSNSEQDSGVAAPNVTMNIKNNEILVSKVNITMQAQIFGSMAGSTQISSDTYTGDFNHTISDNKLKITDSTFAVLMATSGGEMVNPPEGGGTPGTMNISLSNNIFEMENCTVGSGNQIMGAATMNGSANNNKLFITNSTIGYGSTVAGAQAMGGDAHHNYVKISNSTFLGESYGSQIFGGYTEGGYDVHDNELVIESGNYNMSCFIGGSSEISGKAYNNTVSILNDADTDCTVEEVQGGRSNDEATGNIVNIGQEGGKTTFSNMVFTKLYGGSGSISSGNKLNLHTRITASEVGYFQEMNFTLPKDVAADDTIISGVTSLSVDGAGGEATVNVYAAKGVKLNKDDVITLVDSDDTSDTFVGGDILGGAAAFYSEADAGEDLNGDGDEKDLVITLLKDYSNSGSEDQQKAPVEGIAAAVQTINMSADLASGEGMASLVAETAEGFTNTFSAITAGQSKYKTGSHVDVDGWGFLVGAGKTKEWKNGTATTYGLFFEYGKGDFDTYNGNVHGDGNSENKGIGIMARHKLTNNTYYEGNIRFGKQETEWSQSELGSYDTDSRYYGISVGMGHIYPAGKNEIDVYGRYTFGHVGACDATVGDSHYNFESVKSHRVRLGAKYNFVQEKSNAKPFIGLAWEHEFKGESKASISGVGEAPAPSMKGNVGIFELGCDWDVSKKWTLGLGANAYMGKRKGWDGMARVFYNF